MTTDETTREEAINRRDFLRQGGAVGVGLGVALDATTRATASGMPDGRISPGTDIVPALTDAIPDLRERLGSAKVLAPGDPDYEKSGRPMNGRYRQIRPAAIARCADESDVIKCLRWCRDHGVLRWSGEADTVTPDTPRRRAC